MTRSATKVMLSLIGLIKPLLLYMIGAVSLGVIGYLCAIFMTILAALCIASLLGYPTFASVSTMLTIMVICAVARGFLRYGEQASNHYIAFTLLALIRNTIFSKLRVLAPAKLEGKDKGNLISIITSDIELLEVFYAHTISPIAIAIACSLILVIFIGSYHVILGLIALVAYVIIGYIIPVVFSKKGAMIGQNFRNEYGGMNSFILDSLRGIKESIQFKHGEKRILEMNQKTDDLEAKQLQLKVLEGQNRAVSDATVLLCSLTMLVVAMLLYVENSISFDAVIISVVAMLSSFGPVLALSSLANNLYHTIASGNRVLDILEESPVVEEVVDNEATTFGDVSVNTVTFGYEDETILEDVSMDFKKNSIVGIFGKSGSGKSTLLKLCMRFWEVQKGSIQINDTNVNDINTQNLRDMQAYVTQDTYIFNDSIANNISLGKDNITMEQIEEAAKKASIHDFITELPNGYDTNVGELGSSLSGGEKQRLGVARAFLHNANLILLDEPTSNLDSLNEAVILRSLKLESEDKTIILVSHRESTMQIVDTMYAMGSSRES